MKPIIALVFSITLLACERLQAQSYTGIPGVDQVTVIDSDRIIHAHISVLNQEFEPAKNRFYSWFKAGRIIVTEGAFGGYLLDGLYVESYPDKNLYLRGYYINGLKEGDWKSWNVNGTYAAVSSYHDGLRSGNYSTYDSLGTVTEKGRFRNNKLEGTQTKYLASGKQETFRFHRGILISNGKPGLFGRFGRYVKGMVGRVFPGHTGS